MFDELRSIQHEFGYLPADQLRRLSARIDVPLSQIHAVASFYPHFQLTPPPQVDVRVCADMSCHLRGGVEVKAALDQAFRGTSPEAVSVRDVSCLGRCDQAPAISINDRIYCERPGRAHHRGGEGPAVGWRPSRARARSSANGSGVRSLQRCFKLFRSKAVCGNPRLGRHCRDPESQRPARHGRRGLPTGIKWEIVRNAPGKEKYIVCNADESEPGTIKDRFIMGNAPWLVIEGMIIAGLVTGARRGILYIRHEYENQRKFCRKKSIAVTRTVAGPEHSGQRSEFDLELFVSPGGYICGEESALLEAIEGKRAEPRNKPPFPGTNGLWNKPTAINNVETFAFATVILVRGVEWFKAQGENGSAGMKFVGISGDVNRPGVFEVPMGTKYSELILDHAGGVLKGPGLLGFAPSGPSSGYLPASMVDLPLDWNALAAAGSMVGSGAIVVCAEGRCMLDMALNAVRFYRNESCGKCVPCRVGSQKMVEMLTGWTEGEGFEFRLATARRTLLCDEADLDLRPGPDCSRAHPVRAETFSPCGG